MALIHSILIGAVAGMRSMAPLAAVAKAARDGALPVDNGAPKLLEHRVATAGGLALAAGELAGDKTRSAPDRTVPAGMIARMAVGAIAGAALAPRRQRTAAALLGAGAAVASAYLSVHMRKRAAERIGQKPAGVIEDVIAVGSSALIARSAAKE